MAVWENFSSSAVSELLRPVNSDAIFKVWSSAGCSDYVYMPKYVNYKQNKI